MGFAPFAGISLQTPWSNGDYPGNAHHLRPLKHGGDDSLDNCVYLCWGDHLLLGHGMAPFDIDEQGGSSSTWVQLAKEDFKYWDGNEDQAEREID